MSDHLSLALLCQQSYQITDKDPRYHCIAGGVSLSGHSTQHQAAESTMILQVVLSGKSVQESIAQGYLSGAGALSIDPRYLITGLGRNFDITALGRSFAL